MDVLPDGVAATWVWWGTALAAVLWLARYVIASRRVGRKPRPRLILFAAALVVGGALLSRSNSPWQALVLVLVPATFAWAWFRRDRTKLELGPSVYAVDIWAEVINPPSLFFPQARGHVRLFAGEGTIATRSLRFGATTSGWLDSFGQLTFTFRAADCEVDRPLMGVTSFLVSHGKPSIVLRGTDRRGEVELALARPSAAAFEWQPRPGPVTQPSPSLEDVQRELIRAGARPAGGQFDPQRARLGPVIQPDPPPAVNGSPPMEDRPPYWPPPPGWTTKAHEAPARPES